MASKRTLKRRRQRQQPRRSYPPLSPVVRILIAEGIKRLDQQLILMDRVRREYGSDQWTKQQIHEREMTGRLTMPVEGAKIGTVINVRIPSGVKRGAVRE